MLKRILAGVVGIPLIILVVVFSASAPILIDIAIALVCGISVGEFAHATKTLKLYQIGIPSILFALAYPMLMTYGFGMMVIYAYTAVMLAMMVFFHEKISFRQFAYIFSMTLVITVSLSTIITMKNADPARSAFYFLLALWLPWLADIGAYFTGSFLGKHKMCPKISPKKTIEGAVGGTVFCVLATCGLAWLFADVVYQHTVRVDYLSLSILSFVGSLFSIIGDLSFSVVKRTFDVKDYGHLIPGHGGMLDRFDSVIFVSPLIMFYITYFPVLILQTAS